MIKLEGNCWSTFTSGITTVKLKGYIRYKDALLLDAPSVFNYLISEKELDDRMIKDFFSKDDVSGSFGCVIENGSKTILITDIIRSQPLHIIRNDDGFEVVTFIDPENPQPLNDRMVNIFLDLGFSPGAANCFENVYSLQAAEIVTIEGAEISSHRYFRYTPTNSSDGKDLNQLVQEFNNQLEDSIKSMILSAPSVNNWILPLSGGHDSRLLVNYLYKAGVRNVICFSYGTCNNLQSRLSEQVARAAGYDWHFVEYSDEKWDKLHQKGIVDNYLDYSFQGISTPHLQDFLAVFELKEKGIIQDGDIFVPGHSCITPPFTEEAEKLKNENEAILHSFNRCSKRKASTIDKVPDQFKNIFIERPLHPSNYSTYLNWQGRQTKFIGNSIRVYEFFGFRTRMPFWDKRLAEFWLSLSSSYRLRRNFMFIAEKHGILVEELKAIPYEDKLNPKRKKVTLLTKLKEILPTHISTTLLRVTGKKRKVAEGVIDIYSKRGRTVKDIIRTTGNFPKESHSLIKPYLHRYPYQMNFHLLTRLLTIRRAYDNQNKKA